MGELINAISPDDAGAGGVGVAFSDVVAKRRDAVLVDIRDMNEDIVEKDADDFETWIAWM